MSVQRGQMKQTCHLSKRRQRVFGTRPSAKQQQRSLHDDEVALVQLFLTSLVTDPAAVGSCGQLSR